MARIFSKRTLAVLLTLVMMVNLFSVSAQAAVAAAPETVQNFPDTYYKQDGTAGTAGDWEIHLSKTAAPTDQDNVYDITLRIETKDTTIQTAGSTDGAAVLVLDVSNSMNTKETGCAHEGCEADRQADIHCMDYERRNFWKDECENCNQTRAQHDDHHRYTQKTQLDSLKAAVADFLDTFAAGAQAGEKRMVAVVAFGTKAKTIQTWVDVNNATALAALKATINSLSTGDGAYLGKDYLFNGGTNMEGGLVLGRNLLKQTNVLAGIPAENQSLILFSDGAPTAAVSDANSTSVTEIGYAGNDTGSKTNGIDYDDIASILSGVSAAKIAVAYNYNDNLGILKVPPFTRVINSGASSLSVDLTAEAGKVITNKTNASTVTDPMGTGVSMITVSTGYNAKVQQWDLSKFVPTVDGGITTYTITYQVQIDPLAVQLDPAHPGYTVLTPANGATTLNYTYGESNTPVVADFNEPSIRGIRTFTVSYEYVGEVPAGAPEVPADQTYKAGAAVQVATVPALENYTFSGWSTTDFVMPAENVVITGYWTENAKYGYELIYNANFGSFETKADAENISGIYETSHSITVDANTFVRENYTFIGWNTDPNGTGTAYEAADVITLTAENNTEVLYAQWAENAKYDYSLIYNANFGENETKLDTENISGTYATAYRITVDANTFVRENYTFTGWNTKADGTGIAYAAEDVIALTADNNTAVLYAQWVENEKYDYSVIYNANFGAGETKLDAENVPGTYASTYDIGVDENTFVREHYIFLGWSDAPNGQVVYLPGDNIHFEGSGSKTLYALWAEDPKYSYTVIYNGNGGALEDGEIAYGDGQNAENVYETTHSVDVDANTFVRENYTFIGWNTAADGTGTAYAAEDIIALTAEENTLTLYAQWEENPKFDYSVSYVANFGEEPETKLDAENVSGVYDVTYEITTDENTFVRRGYTFIGWNTAADGTGTAYAAEDVIALTAEENTLTLYAQWEINEYAYQVVYMVRVNGNAYELFAGQLPEGAPIGENAAFGTVIDKEYLDARGLPAELTDGTYTYSFNAFEGTTIAEEENVVTVYYTCIYEPPVEPPVEIPEEPTEEPEEEIEIPEEDVPLDSSPKTGESIPVQLATAALSGIGLITLLGKKSKKEEEIEA